MNWLLAPLLALLFALGWLAHTLYTTLRRASRRCGTVDLTGHRWTRP